MGAFFHNCGNGEVSRKLESAIHKAIKRTDSTFVYTTSTPGSGPRWWFEAPNRGSPFDAREAADVSARLKAAGLLDADGCLDTSIGRRR